MGFLSKFGASFRMSDNDDSYSEYDDGDYNDNELDDDYDDESEPAKRSGFFSSGKKKKRPKREQVDKEQVDDDYSQDEENSRYDGDSEESEEEPEEKPRRKPTRDTRSGSRQTRGGRKAREDYSDDSESEANDKIVGFQPKRKRGFDQAPQPVNATVKVKSVTNVSIFSPKSLKETEDIGRAIEEGNIVIINFEGIDYEMEMCISWFIFGAMYLGHLNSFQCNAHFMVLSPHNVKITSEDVANIIEDAKNNVKESY